MGWRERRRKLCYFTKPHKGDYIPTCLSYRIAVSAEMKYLKCVIKMLYSIKMLVSLLLSFQVFKRRRRTEFRCKVEAVRKHSEVQHGV